MIEKPAIRESLQYGAIISWKFRDTVTPVRKRYAYRFILTFANGKSFHKAFKLLLKECCLPDMRWHDLCHTYATILKENEISLKAISVCMGHYGTDITENVYINLPEEEVFSCEKEMTAFMAEILPQQNGVLDICISEEAMLSYFGKRYA